MTTTDTAPGLSLPEEMSAGDAARLRGLRRMRALALSLLVLAAVVYVLTREHDTGWLGYVNAGSEAAMVGAIADWFAVTALFRHPLGLPIPHTAIIPNRKESLGESLQEFVADNFLKEEVIRERIGSAGVSRRAGEWVIEGRHADRIVREGSRILADALSHVRESDVAAVIQEALIPRLEEEELSPVVGQLLDEILRDGAHHGLVDLAVDELARWLDHNHDEVAALIENRAPSWTPQWLDKRVSTWVHEQVVEFVAEIGRTPDHNARQALDSWLRELAQDLQHDPDTMARFERLKVRMLTQPRVSTTSIQLWDALRRAVIGSLGDETGLLRTRATEEIERLGHRLIDDEQLSSRVDTTISNVAAYAVNNYGHEVATIISATVNRWDGKETADRIELHVGRDLQFIRINGTVVGGLAGLVIHAISTVI
ncbi:MULTISPECIES: DUF445 domain-containing protein [Aeromicrobium]|uniref:DUF445 domain-containing protein n=1 Tax=Aeromicrobium TaxID=2040 RepID=UPI000AC6B3AF|nr:MULTISPECIES: DUF445 domain-containing protein [Aeromicrobium]MCL8250529.1 DUF445 domain-containing protein [Aeromicrobium fastidiosum]